MDIMLRLRVQALQQPVEYRGMKGCGFVVDGRGAQKHLSVQWRFEQPVCEIFMVALWLVLQRHEPLRSLRRHHHQFVLPAFVHPCRSMDLTLIMAFASLTYFF